MTDDEYNARILAIEAEYALEIRKLQIRRGGAFLAHGELVYHLNEAIALRDEHDRKKHEAWLELYADDPLVMELYRKQG
jgi:hypothetical protein